MRHTSKEATTECKSLKKIARWNRSEKKKHRAMIEKELEKVKGQEERKEV